jgi:hypothetical protein
MIRAGAGRAPEAWPLRRKREQNAQNKWKRGLLAQLA